LQGRRFDESLHFAEAQLQNYPQDVRFTKCAPRAMPVLGGVRSSIRPWPRRCFAGADGGAIEQLQLAQRAGDANFYELSVIDARLRELRSATPEELKEKRN
jgi:predicted Zn-dependent protease